MEIKKAPDIQKSIERLIPHLPMTYIDSRRITCVRSFYAKSRARARIWSFPKIWQLALGKPPHYVIEVLSQHYDHLSADDKIRVLIHELMHIPKNFSGALVPHRGLHKRINSRAVESLFKLYFQSAKTPPQAGMKRYDKREAYKAKQNHGHKAMEVYKNSR
ncbi:MAG: putative metallopeptidase [Patescibacteria group bacterium]